MKDLAIQIKCIGLFIQGYKPLLEFIEIGGTQILLEVLGFHYYKNENEDKKEALLLLTNIANNGRKYKEVICFDNGLDLLRNSIIYIPSIDINLIAKNFIVSIYQGNPKHSNDILELLFDIFRNHSSPNNWKTISAHLSSNNTPRRNSTINLLDNNSQQQQQTQQQEMNAFSSPRSIFNSPRVFGNFLMSPRTPNVAHITNTTTNSTTATSKNVIQSPSSSISFQPGLTTPKNEATPKQQSLPFTKFTFLNVVETARNQLASAEEFRKSFDPSNTNNNMNNSNNTNTNNTNNTNTNDNANSIELSTQSILLIYSMIKEISKSIKIEQMRETRVLDIIFMNLSDEDIRVVRESVEMVKIAMQYPDENEIFSEMLIHRSIQGLSMIVIVLGKRRFKTILKQFFKNSNYLNNSKEEINYSKNFLNLIFGACSIMNLILENAIEHVNICKIMFESNIILTLIESILIIKEKYGDTHYCVDTSKEMTQLLRVIY
ncbi:predicted protein [Naegleria gruberi]|uniref:Predicted protein n=1 Tax=Naegleria gruberi TaxID=5762 RepID=D2VXC4_NAEGR|nr:uncharacterized protein NAEGRDRAFT_73696 [Naegleria gruberi]EFC38418.1 predicted protein [Naegleria gruberi]|eukprot:XP_002671162.1 predicted protein [Naegleria gruberi strain NEG-M]